MPVVRITKNAVEAASPTSRDHFLWDDRLSGFGVKVTPAANKVFLYQYRMGGRGSKVRRFTIGRYGKLTVEQARKRAELLASDVTRGVDPQQHKVTARNLAAELAFRPYVERFREGLLEREWKTHRSAYNTLLRHAVPILGDTPLTDISRRDVRALLDNLSAKPATAFNLFAILRRLFNWAVEREDLNASPIEGLRPPPKPKARHRVLSDDELLLVWQATGALGYPFCALIRILILTGARLNEVAGMDWAELNRETASWSLPANRAKNARQAENALSRAAVKILDEVAARSGLEGRWPQSGFVFSTTGRTPVSGFSKAKARLDRAVKEEATAAGLPAPADWRLHDLRRTLATGFQKLGERLEVTEAVLNHVSGSRGGIVGIYQRYDWHREKRVALEKWALHLETLLSAKLA